MNISGIGNQFAQNLHRNNRGQGDAAGSGPVRPEDVTTARAQSESTTAETGATPEAAGTKGVVNLLSEGHFKGVAAVRLSINFHQELQAVATQKEADTLKSSSQTLTTDLETKVEGLADQFTLGDQTDGLVSSFADTVNGLFDNGATSPFDPASAIASIRSAFEDLFNALSQLFPGSTDSSTTADTTSADLAAATADGALGDIAAATAADSANTDAIAAGDAAGEDTNAAAADDQTDDVASTASASEAGTRAAGDASATAQDAAATAAMSNTDFMTALQSLHDWFSSTLDDMEKSMIESVSLPTFSAPHGRGVAYNRFLAIYNDLNGVSGSSASGDQAGGQTSGVKTEA